MPYVGAPRKGFSALQVLGPGSSPGMTIEGGPAFGDQFEGEGICLGFAH